ncbi:MAG TPA: hypothetical protein VMZ53_02195 [Kofleriaceae bacterium]|nr:hypothetical protein [Kofleriaceae bacterium]
MVMRAALALAVALLAFVACGGSSKPAAQQPISNTDKTGGTDSSTPPGHPAEGRVIQRTGSGGVIELIGDRAGAMRQANDEMSSHCGPNNYTIVQEGEESIAAEDGGPRTATAWRVHYQCNGS